MPLYVGDYLADTTHLTTTEHGTYLLLLLCMWRSGGSLPADDAKLARFAKLTKAQWDRSKGVILGFFEIENGLLIHPRLSKELTKHTNAVEQRAIASSNGGKAKALKDKELALAAAKLTACQPEPEPYIERTPTAIAAVPQPNAASGSRLPSGWTPDPESLSTENPDLAQAELAKFRDYWSSSPGAQGRKADWQATWRNWLRRAAETHSSRNSHGQRPHHDAKFNARQENHARAFAAADRAAGLREEP